MKPRPAADAEPRFLLYHLHPLSSRLLFMRHATGSVLTPRPLPWLSSPVEGDGADEELDPVLQLRLGMQIHAGLGFEPGTLVVERKFLRQAEIPMAVVNLHLARFIALDPPHEEIQAKGGQFCSITELQGGHPVEMALLRWAYEFLLGG
ncbi:MULTISPECIES: hypothetical protein [Methylococcus]|uniref:Uncharacterized protein n=1 Tax=Methylococcus capsulatus TaxID=414 RepID=A0ABZ2F4X3_METCP|nr:MULTISPECIES: hypothetical protein [Methylococcus]MDF9391830.1 hypothetical protein [Methylococcus capsulatus]